MRQAAALGDQALVQQMREGDLFAWAEFDHRFRPILRLAAHRVGIPPEEAETSITETLDDEAMRLGSSQAAPPTNLTAYLLRALRSAHLTRKRAMARRARWYAEASTELHEGTRVQHLVRSVCSEAMLRSSEPALVSEGASDSPGPLGVEGDFTTSAVGRWILVFARELSALEWRMLGWISEQVPRRSIAEWTGAEYEATKRRLTRLVVRLRARALERLPELSREDQREIIGWLRRAGVSQSIAAQLAGRTDRRENAEPPSDPQAGGKQ
jgi:hypothetical protein